MDSLAETIRQIPIFSGLAREDLARIAGKLVEEPIPAGQVVFSQGDEGDALYIVKSGTVEVVVAHEDFRVKKAFLGPFESFGEMALLTGEKRSATVLAVVDTVLLKLAKGSWDDFISKNPNLSLYFYKILTRRLTETEKDMTRGLRALDRVMEEFFNALTEPVQNLLLHACLLEKIDADALGALLAMPNPDGIISKLSENHPGLIRAGKDGSFAFLDHLKAFLCQKLARRYEPSKIKALHRGFGDFFAARGKRARSLFHYVAAEAWAEAGACLKRHGADLLEEEGPEAMLACLESLPRTLYEENDDLTRLLAEAYERAGDLDRALIHYRIYLSRKKGPAATAGEIARRYEKMADLSRSQGKTGQALDCLKLAVQILKEGRADTDILPAMDAVVDLQEERGASESALHWEMRALTVARKLAAKARRKIFFGDKNTLFLSIALLIGLGVWFVPPKAGLDRPAIHFLATLLPAILLWVTDTFEIYVVALMMMLTWILLGVVPPKLALSGFSKSSWLFVLSVLGIGAAVTRSGLLYRLALLVVRKVPPNYRLYSVMLGFSGLLVTPVLPQNQARTAIMAPISQVLSEIMGFKERSNGSAGLVLSAYMGFSQMNFMFLSAAAPCFVGWSLLSESQQAEFGWFAWATAALPAGVFTLCLIVATIQIIFSVRAEDQAAISPTTLKTQLEVLGPLTRAEWLGVGILTLALAGWLTKPLHGIKEAWIAVAALVAFMLTGGLNKRTLKNNIDWGYLLFLAVMLSLSSIIPYLKLDQWLTHTIGPFLMTFSGSTTLLLVLVALMVYGVRFFLNKSSTVVLFMLVLGAWSPNAGIHPGVLLLTVLMALEAWFLPYQTSSYQIAYYSTEEKAFSHIQARKIMMVKFVVSLLAIAISVPYWRLLGFVQ